MYVDSLVCIWGNLESQQDKVKVTDTGVGQEVSVSVEFVAPEQPGMAR